MPRRFGIIALICAWLCASGALLDGMQAVAWARMFAGYARTMPLGEAAAETMAGGRPCSICRAVEKARETGGWQQKALNVTSERLLLFCERVDPPIMPVTVPEWQAGEPGLPQAPIVSVAVPPPRSGRV